MMRLLAALGAGIIGGVAIFLPVSHETSLPFVEPPRGPVRVLFVGDLMLDRNVARSAEAEGVAALFSTSTRALFADADLHIVNLEGTITTEPSLARQNNKILRFTFVPATAAAVLRDLGVDAVSLANNHAFDFGPEGYASTRNYLSSFGVAAFGHPYNNSAYRSTALELAGKRLCFVGYHALFEPDTAPVEEEIAAIRPDCWRLIVLAHWGEEYKPKANAAQKGQGRAFIDAGADLVVGAHPHVVEEVELYKGKAIFYSLGNFMFDQNFSWETTHGLAIRVDFEEEETHFSLIPMVIKNQTSSVAEGSDRQKILNAAGTHLPDGQVANFQLP